MKLQGIIAFSLLVFWSITTIVAQKVEDQVWHKGFLVFDTKDTLEGLIMYDFRNNFVQYQKGDDYRVLLPGRFQSVCFVSSIDSSSHNFDVFEVQTGPDYFRPYFFEVIDTTGKIKLLKQYFWVQRTSSFGQFGGFSISYDKVINLYKLSKNNKVEYIKNKKKNILALVVDKKELIKAEVANQRWRYTNSYDVIKILNYYNSQFK